jgi:hypothetical protein
MPGIRVYNGGWQADVTAASVYVNPSWRTITSGWVYDSGVWRLVFPSTVIPSVNISSTAEGRNVGGSLYVSCEASTVDDANNIVYAELYNGSPPIGVERVPFATQNVAAYSTSGTTANYSVVFTGGSLINGNTYTIRLTAVSVSNDEAKAASSAINLSVPEINISYVTVNTVDFFSVGWFETEQARYRVKILNAAQQQVFVSNGGNWTESTFMNEYSSAISPPLQASTNYTVVVEIQTAGFETVSDSQAFVSPAVTPAVTITTTTPTSCAMTVNWSTVGNVAGGNIEVWELVGGVPTYLDGTYNWTSQRSYTFTGLVSSTLYQIEATCYDSNSVPGLDDIVQVSTLAGVPPNPPTGMSAVSDTSGQSVTISWSHGAANCATRTGYTVQFSSSASGPWTNLSTSVGASETSLIMFSSVNTTYYFRMWAKSATGNSTITSAQVTTFNPATQMTVNADPTSILTSATSTISMQLKNTDGNNATTNVSGRTVTWSTNLGSVTATSTTNSSGWASTTLTSGTTAGTATVSAAVSGVTGNSTTVTVSLRTGLSTGISSVAQAYGFSVSQTYNSLYTYSGSITSGGSLRSGAYASSAYTVFIPIQQNGSTRPLVEVNKTTKFLNCSNNSSFIINPTGVTTTITTSRAGYQNGTNTTGKTPTRSATYAYQWQYSTAGSSGPWTNWNTTQSFTYSSAITTTRWVRCSVTPSGGESSGPTLFTSNTVTIP